MVFKILRDIEPKVNEVDAEHRVSMTQVLDLGRTLSIDQ